MEKLWKYTARKPSSGYIQFLGAPVAFPLVSHLYVRVTAFTGVPAAALNSSRWGGFSPNARRAASENFARVEHLPQKMHSFSTTIYLSVNAPLIALLVLL